MPSRSLRLADLVQSDIRRMTRECNAVGGLNLGQGICDLPTHELVKQGAIDAINADKSIYTLPEGVVELREAIAEKLQRDNGIAADPSGQIVVTIGASGAFTCAVHALLDAGDGAILFEPYYGYHLNTLLVAGLEPQFCPLEMPRLSIDFDRLEATVAENTRAIVICTPANPSGKMYSREELETLAEFAEKHDLLVITDEIYEYITYDGRKHLSPATIDGLEERTVSIMGLSKTFSITGWRLGYAVAPAEMARAMTLVNDLFYVCAPHPLQLGGAAGFKAPRSYFTGMQRDYQQKRDTFCAALTEAGMDPLVPQGAYYVLADLSSLGCETSLDGAMRLLKEAGIASVPGSSFFQGPEGESVTRFCFAKEDSVLNEACERLRAFRPVAKP